MTTAPDRPTPAELPSQLPVVFPDGTEHLGTVQGVRTDETTDEAYYPVCVRLHGAWLQAGTWPGSALRRCAHEGRKLRV